MKRIYLGILFILLVGSMASAMSVEQALSAEIIPGRFNIFSPIDGSIYDHRMIQINLSMSGKVKKFRYGYLDNGGNLVTLCRDCTEYGFFKLKRKPFDDGFHKLTLLGIFEHGVLIQDVNFTVDTKNPKIQKTFPKKGLAMGNFEVFFQEANPKNLTLFYKNESLSRDKIMNIDHCLKKDNINYQCQINVNLSEFNGKEIEYWFELKDILGNKDESRHRSLLVDYNPI